MNNRNFQYSAEKQFFPVVRIHMIVSYMKKADLYVHS